MEQNQPTLRRVAPSSPTPTGRAIAVPAASATRWTPPMANVCAFPSCSQSLLPMCLQYSLPTTTAEKTKCLFTISASAPLATPRILLADASSTSSVLRTASCRLAYASARVGISKSTSDAFPQTMATVLPTATSTVSLASAMPVSSWHLTAMSASCRITVRLSVSWLDQLASASQATGRSDHLSAASATKAPSSWVVSASSRAESTSSTTSRAGSASARVASDCCRTCATSVLLATSCSTDTASLVPFMHLIMLFPADVSAQQDSHSLEVDVCLRLALLARYSTLLVNHANVLLAKSCRMVIACHAQSTPYMILSASDASVVKPIKSFRMDNASVSLDSDSLRTVTAPPAAQSTLSWSMGTALYVLSAGRGSTECVSAQTTRLK